MSTARRHSANTAAEPLFALSGCLREWAAQIAPGDLASAGAAMGAAVDAVVRDLDLGRAPVASLAEMTRAGFRLLAALRAAARGGSR